MVGLTAREGEILDMLNNRDGGLTVSQLSAHFGVSAVTIRNDIRNLDAKGLVMRMRGSVFSSSAPQLSLRTMTNTQKKESIARAAASLVGDGDCIMITNGSTCSLIPRYLFGLKHIRVVTNSTHVFQYARSNYELEVTITGGEFRPKAEALVGPMTIEQIDNYHVALAFFGTDGLTLEHGLTTGMEENAQVVRKMCSQATKKVLVTDSSKVGNRGFVKIMDIVDVDTIITDSGFPAELKEKLEGLGVEVIIAQ